MITAVMTGASSGLGCITLKKLSRESDIRIITGSRTQSPNSLLLDLSKLDSVRAFAAKVIEAIGENSIDIVILNAGTQSYGLTKSVDGYEMTFAVNHLAHYLLLRLLLPHLAENARIIMTSSGTYDPAEKTIIPAPKHANAIYLAFPERDPDRDTNTTTASGRAYSSSKLCTMLTVRALNNAAALKVKNIKAFAYDPGAIPGTGLVRNNKFLIRVIWAFLGLPLLWRIFPGSNSKTNAGNALSDLALGKIAIAGRGYYAALRRGRITTPELSDLAKRDDLAEILWRESEALVALYS